MIPQRRSAIILLNEFVDNENLKRHMYAVEAAMRAYAKKLGEDEDKWGIAGLLHDADWEKFSDDHPRVIVERLKEMNVDDGIVQAIASHGNNSDQYPQNYFEERRSKFDSALFACDELAGFIVAVARVRPNGLDDLKAKSVKKKLKDKGFAAQVNRDDIRDGADELGVELDEHIEFVIKALRSIKEELGF
ncbi:MAG: HD domain-containing protein [Candidatus Dojkabacteria bacterium]